MRYGQNTDEDREAFSLMSVNGLDVPFLLDAKANGMVAYRRPPVCGRLEASPIKLSGWTSIDDGLKHIMEMHELFK